MKGMESFKKKEVSNILELLIERDEKERVEEDED